MKAGTARPDLRIILRPMMLFRLIVATAFLIVGFFVLDDGSYPFFLLIGTFYFLTIIYLLIIQSHSTPLFLPYVQMTVDFVIITCLICVAKSMGGIFLFLYLIPIVSASLYFGMKQSVMVALGCGLTYCSIILYKNHAGYSEGTVANAYLLYTMFLNLVIFYVVGFLCGYLGRLVSMKGLELGRLQKLHNLILDNMNSGLISVGNDGRIVYSNSAAEGILGHSASDLKGEKLSELFIQVEEGEGRPLGLSEATDKPNGGSRAESLGVTRQGKEIPIGYNVSLIRDQEGEIVGKIIVFTDLTKVKRLEEELRQADKLKAVGELAAGIAHEIRNPLAAISGSVEMLAGLADLDEGNRRLFDVVLKESSRLNIIIEGLLNYTRDRAAELQRVDTVEMLEEIAMLMENDPALSDNIEISIDTRQDDVDIVGDSGQLKQVFLNLIKNAADAMPEGGHIGIAVSRQAGSDAVEIVVSDTGCGIEEGHLEDIFNPFFTTKSSGIGIGLSLAEKIIRNHGGQISVKSRRGEGTTFVISVPAWVDRSVAVGVGAYGENTDS